MKKGSLVLMGTVPACTCVQSGQSLCCQHTIYLPLAVSNVSAQNVYNGLTALINTVLSHHSSELQIRGGGVLRIIER